MRALRWFGRGDVRIEEITVPAPGPHEVQLRVGFCGICGTDLEEYSSGPLLIPISAHPLTGAMAPLTLGHEFWGTVSAVGADVRAFKLGDRVVPEVCLYCGECVYCREGRYALCQSWAAVGLHRDGGLAEFVCVSAKTCVPVPEEVGGYEAALVEPLEVAVRAVRKAELRAGGTLVITGAGPIGLLVLQVAKSSGAGRVVVVEPREARRRLAASLGADRVVAPGNGAAESQVIAAIGEPGADAAVECAGHTASIQLAFQTVRKGGRIVLVGIPTEPSKLDLMPLIVGERTVIGSVQHQKQEDLAAAVELLQTRSVDVTALISDVIPLSGAAEALRRLSSTPSDSMKVLIDPGR